MTAHLETCGHCRQIVDSLGRLTSPGERLDASTDSQDPRRLDSLARRMKGDELRETVIKDPAEPEDTTAGHVLLSTLDSAGSVDRYTLTRLHASGGMGRVWLARDASIGRDVALKELLPESADDPRVWQRFVNEARVTGRLEHPGIVPVYEVNAPEDAKPFYTMRFVRGQTLHEAARGFRQLRGSGEPALLRLRELVTATIGVCNAVAYAHSRGVLHRDLKGRNIVLGDFGEVIVLDWGLASVYADDNPQTVEPIVGQQTLDGQIVGTPRFMAPEQATGARDQLSPATDVYGLGAVLYEILTGEPPIAGDSSEEILQNVIHQPPSPPREHWAEVPRPLEAVCLQALAKNPADRYETPLELAADLQRWLADQSVSAFPDPLSVRLARWARGHRTLVTSCAVLLLTAVTALTIATVALSAEQSRTEIARARAERNLNRAREAVDSMLTRVGSERLRNIPQMELLRRELLEEAVRFHEEFLEESDAPQFRAEAAQAHRRAAGVYHMLGQSEDALNSLQAATGLLDDLSIISDDMVPFERAECRALAAAVQLSLGNFREAAREAQSAIDLFAELDTEEQPLSVVHQQSRADCWLLLADALRLDGRTGTAQDALRQLIATTADDNDRDHRLTLAEVGARVRLAALLKSDSRLTESAAEYATATTIGRTLYAARPSDADVAETLSTSLQQYASLLTLSGDRRESAEILRESLPIHEQLAADYPHVTSYRQAFTDCLSQLAALLATSGQTDQARPMFVRANEQAESLADDYPDLVEHQLSAAASAQALGAFFASERQDGDAQRVLEVATRRLRSLPPEMMESPAIQGRLGALLKAYAKAASWNEDYELALELAEEYVGILERLARMPNPTAEVRDQLAQGYRLLSTTHTEVNHPADALQWLTKAVDVQRKLVADYPQINAYGRQLAISLSSKAARLLKDQQPEQARQLHAEAQQIRQAIHDREPTWTVAHSELASGHRYMARILTAQQAWEAADAELDTAIALLQELESRDSVSDLFNQQALTLLARTDVRLAEGKLAAAIVPLDQAIQIYRDEHELRPELKHATRGLYRFLRRKADIRIQQHDYLAARRDIQEAEQLTLPDEWGNPYEVALLICRSLTLIDQVDTFDAAAAQAEKQKMAALALRNVRLALEFGCPAQEFLDVRAEISVLSLLPDFGPLLQELENAPDPNRLWKHADDASVLKPRKP